MKKCSYEGGEWVLYQDKEASILFEIIFEDQGHKEASLNDVFCRANKDLWDSRTVAVGSEVFISSGNDDTQALRDVLEANGFKTSDFKPDFC